MKKMLMGAAALALMAGGAGAEEVKLQLKWVTQAQFAGYYVAAAKGYYEAEGLDVTIQPGGPDIAPEQVIAGGGADVIVDWMPPALAARDRAEAARDSIAGLTPKPCTASGRSSTRISRSAPPIRRTPPTPGMPNRRLPTVSSMNQLSSSSLQPSAVTA